MNVPAPSDRTIQIAIASCEFEVTADIQVWLDLVAYGSVIIMSANVIV